MTLVAAANGNEKEKEIPKTLESKREFDESLSLIDSNQTGNLRINLGIQLDEEVEKGSVGLLFKRLD